MSEQLPGQRIRSRRKQLKLSQDSLGAAAGISGSSISLWENGNTFPTGKNLHSLAHALQCSPTWILFGDEDKTPGEPVPIEEKFNLSDDEKVLVELYRQLPKSAQEDQIEEMKARAENYNLLYNELIEVRQRTQQKTPSKHKK